MARAGVYLGSAGVLLALLAIALPGDPDIDDTLLAAAAAATACGVAVLAIASDRLPYWAFHAFAAGGTLVASAAIYAWGVESLYGPLPYLWVTVYVFWFFPLQFALVHLASIAAAFAAVIAVEDPDFTPVASWVATVGTLLVAGGLISVVRTRTTGLVAGLTDAAHRGLAHGAPEPPRVRGGVRLGAGARAPQRRDLQPDRGRPRPLQAGQRLPGPRRRRRRPAPRGGRPARKPGAASTARPASAARSSRSSPRTPTSTVRTSSPSGCAQRSSTRSGTPRFRSPSRSESSRSPCMGRPPTASSRPATRRSTRPSGSGATGP